MQFAACFISFETALLSESAATMMPAATKASKSAYSTEQMAFSSVHSFVRNFCILLMAFPFLVVLFVELAR